MPYKAPVQDMLFNMRHVANIDAVAQMPGFEDRGLTQRKLCWKSARNSMKKFLPH